MTINFTLVVQAINFIIVYWMLRILLFKPAVAYLQEQAALDAAYDRKAQHLDEQIAAQVNTLEQRKQAMVSSLEQQYPNERQSIMFSFSGEHTLKQESVHSDQMDALEAELVEQLESKVIKL